MNVCVHLCVCTCSCSCVCVCAYVLVHMCVCMCVVLFVCACMCVGVCVSSLWPGEKVMQDDEFTCDLFRFLQLLCEGHNSGVCVCVCSLVLTHQFTNVVTFLNDLQIFLAVNLTGMFVHILQGWTIYLCW